MKGTRWRNLIDRTLRDIHREVRISLTPLTDPESWVFVVGCYNSGTELLMKVLGTHPSISSLPTEGQFLTDQLPKDYELGLPRMWALREELFRLREDDSGPDPVRLKREWLMRLDRTRPVFVEKSPPNAARTRWLQAHFPKARFICMVRDGYAVAEGIRRKAEPTHLRNGWPIELCARQWNRSNEILLEDAAALREAIWVRYEDLTSDPQQEFQRILDFIGVDVERLPHDRSWSVHERNEGIRNMNAHNLASLSLDDVRIIAREAHAMLSHFGYEPPSI